MMIIRTGIDMVDLSVLRRRVERSENDLLAAFLTQQELESVGGRIDRAGTRWAAKEATMKALGWGLDKLDPHQIEVHSDDGEAPQLRLHGDAGKRAAVLGLTQWTLSVSHTDNEAIASVVAIGEVHD
ncbi:holo-ACP synthase [Curtobacterium sp. PhB136]|uniref:holo-ACP synthase n=1 Tax=Curtobacterium sp. PhB136 TaxID=2485181 RepID=UPI0010516745|nr:holo-ACP synthase [Curtobacterium sp. PhB136]TCK65833.1 holo-[acyl-carrier protein] synthase [Curtobacterium sp. PhB136]